MRLVPTQTCSFALERWITRTRGWFWPVGQMDLSMSSYISRMCRGQGQISSRGGLRIMLHLQNTHTSAHECKCRLSFLAPNYTPAKHSNFLQITNQLLLKRRSVWWRSETDSKAGTLTPTFHKCVWPWEYPSCTSTESSYSTVEQQRQSVLHWARRAATFSLVSVPTDAYNTTDFNIPWKMHFIHFLSVY